jgi:hypothetical protein
MKTKKISPDADWTAVIGRVLAALYIEQSDLKDASLAAKANFLMRIGLPLKDAAAILDTSEQSIHQQRYMTKKRKSRPK